MPAERPECGATITFKSSPLLGELVKCADCGKDLAVASVDPITLDLAPEESEDWGQ